MTLTSGTRLGPYEIIEPAGSGGMGDVYRAHDVRLDRDVAVKTLKGPFTERFEREARAISALNHPQHLHAARRRRARGQRLPRDGVHRGQADRRTDAGRAGRAPTASRSARRSTPRTGRASSTATSSPPTSWSPSRASSCSTSAWRSSPASGNSGVMSAPARRAASRRPSPRSPARTPSSARRSTWRPSRSRRARWTRAPTSSRSGACSTSCSPGSARSRGRPRRA